MAAKLKIEQLLEEISVKELEKLKGCKEVKLFDESHEKDLERSVNEFLESTLNEIIEIQFRTAVSIFGEEQVYCFSAMIVYQEKKS